MVGAVWFLCAFFGLPGGGLGGGAEDGVRVESVDCIQVPDFNFGVHCSHRDEVPAGVWGVGCGGADGDVEPFDAEGDSGEHDVVVDVEVVRVVFVDVDFEVTDVVFGFGGDEEVVGGEDLELFALLEGVGVGHGYVGVGLAGLVEGEAFDVAEHAHCCGVLDVCVGGGGVYGRGGAYIRRRPFPPRWARRSSRGRTP